MLLLTGRERELRAASCELVGSAGPVLVAIGVLTRREVDVKTLEGRDVRPCRNGLPSDKDPLFNGQRRPASSSALCARLCNPRMKPKSLETALRE